MKTVSSLTHEHAGPDLGGLFAGGGGAGSLSQGYVGAA